MIPYRAGEECILLRSYIAGVRRKKKIALYGGADTPISEELWLMCDADAHCTLRREGEGPNKQKENFMFNFSCPTLKHIFYFVIGSVGEPEAQKTRS